MKVVKLSDLEFLKLPKYNLGLYLENVAIEAIPITENRISERSDNDTDCVR